MLKKNDVKEAKILRYGMDGEGIAEIDGMVTFVPGALVGEAVQLRVLSVKKSFAYAKIDRIITPAVERRNPTCPVYARCGGCDLSHASYAEQLRIKKAKITSALRRVRGMDAIQVDVVGSDAEYAYRNKVSLPVREVDGKLQLGFFAQRSHRFVPNDGCALHGEALNGLARCYLKEMNDLALSAYDEETRRGYVRHLAIRELSEGYCVTIVVNDDDLSPLMPLIKKVELWNGLPVTLYANVNQRDTNVIFGDKFVRLQGNTPKGKMCGVKFQLHPASFLQVNTPLAERIFSRILDELGETDFLVDAYSGIGITSNVFADKVKKVYSVEILPQAVEDAKVLAQANGNADKIECICGDCCTEIPAVIDKIKGCGSTSVFLDPPRKGCDQQTLNAVLSAAPDKIIYLSCNPASLARDFITLTQGGYKIDSVTGYDLFCQTKHVETLAILTLNDADK